MADEAQKDFDAIRKDMNSLRAELDALIGSLRDQAGERVDHAKADIRDAGERVQQRARQMCDTVSGQIKERPMAALFSAFGIGVVLGALIGRKG